MSAAHSNSGNNVASTSSAAIAMHSQKRTELKFDNYGKSPTAFTSSSTSAILATASSSNAATGQTVQKEKRITMRAVRSIMRLGRSRQNSQSRDSSTEDEGR